MTIGVDINVRRRRDCVPEGTADSLGSVTEAELEPRASA